MTAKPTPDRRRSLGLNEALKGFEPGKGARETPEPDRETVTRVAEAIGFAKTQTAEPERPNRRPRRRRSDRTVQFNQKATPEMVELFYRIAEKQDWENWYTLQRAIEALARELGEGQGEG